MSGAPAVTVACVLRSGGDFDMTWVRKLWTGVLRFLPRSRFSLLTDDANAALTFTVNTPRPEAVDLNLLLYDWPGWWSKLELFRPGLFEPGERVLYLDLDTLPVGDLADLAAYSGAFGMMTGFYRDILQSGVMAWTPGPATDRLWAGFTYNPERAIRSERGDGEWIGPRVPEADRLMDLYPGQIVSLKVHAKEGPPDGARLVLGHGQPRFSDPAAGWAHMEWKSR